MNKQQYTTSVRKEHYKMYKAGKRWVYAAIFVASLGTGAMVGQHAVAADDQAPTDAAQTANKVESTTPDDTHGTVALQTPATTTNASDTAQKPASLAASEAQPASATASSRAASDQASVSTQQSATKTATAAQPASAVASTQTTKPSTVDSQQGAVSVPASDGDANKDAVDTATNAAVSDTNADANATTTSASTPKPEVTYYSDGDGETAVQKNQQLTIADVTALNEVGDAITINSAQDIDANFVLNQKDGTKDGVTSSRATDKDFKKDGDFVVLATANGHGGAYAYQYLIDATKGFSVTGAFKSSVSGADPLAGGSGLGIILQGANPVSAGLTDQSNPNANDGIAATDAAHPGLANAIFAGFDGYPSGTADSGLSTGVAYIRSTDASGNISDKSHSGVATGSQLQGGSSRVVDFTLTWTPTGLATSSTNMVAGNLTMIISDDNTQAQLQTVTYAENLNKATAIAAFGGLGGNSGTREVRIDSVNLTAATATVNVKYVDADGNLIPNMPDAPITANVGSTLTIADTTNVDTLTYAPAVIDGYTFWKATGNATGNNTVNALNMTYATAAQQANNTITLTYVKSPDEGNVDNEPSVLAAKQNLQAVLAAATDPKSQAVNDAVQQLQSAITEATSARTTATTAAQASVGTNISLITHETLPDGTTLQDAQISLKNMLAAASAASDPAHAASYNDVLVNAQQTFDAAIAKANTDRTTIAGKVTVNTAKATFAKGGNKTYNVANSGDVANAIVTYQNLLTMAQTAQTLPGSTHVPNNVDLSTAADAIATAANKVATVIDTATTTLNTDWGTASVEPTLTSLKANLKTAIEAAQNGGSSADLQIAITTFNDAATQLQTDRTTAVGNANALITAGTTTSVLMDTTVRDAIQSLTNVVTATGNNTATTEAIQAATAAAKQAIGDANTAYSNVASAQTTTPAAPVSNEADVEAAIMALNNAKTTSNLTTTDLTQLVTTYNNAVVTANKLRQAALDAGTTALAAAQPVQANNSVATAVTALNKAVASANADTGSTAAVTGAATALTNVVGALNDANTQVQTALNDDGGYVSNEATVQAAHAVLLAAQSNNALTASDLVTAATTYDNVVIDAKKDRDRAIQLGKALAQTTTQTYGANATIMDKVTAFNNSVIDSESAGVTTAAVNDAATAISTAINNETDAMTKANTALAQDATAVSGETAVQTALAALQTATRTTPADPQSAANVATPTDELIAKTTAYNTAVSTAKATRKTTLAAGTAERAIASASQNPEVKQAVANYDAEVILAAQGGVTSDDLNDKITAMNTALGQAAQALTAAKAVQLTAAGAVQNEQAVIDAYNNLNSARQDPTTATATLTNLTDTFTLAVSTAQSARLDVTTKTAATIAGTATLYDPTSQGIMDNPTVAAAKTAYDAVVTGSQNTTQPTATTQDITNASGAVTSAIAAAKTARDAVVTAHGNETLTANQSVADEADVSAALITLNDAYDLANNKTTSTADLTAAASIYNKAVTDALFNRNTALTAGNAVESTTQGDATVAQNPDVLQAISDYETTKTEAGKGQKTTLDVSTAANAIGTAVTAAGTARQNASDLLAQSATAVANEDIVSQANAALTNALTNPATATSALTALTTSYKQALSNAAGARDKAEKDGQAIADAVSADARQNTTVAATIADFTSLVTAADNGSATTAQLNAAAGAITTAQNAAATAKTAATTALTINAAPVANETDVYDALTKLTAAINDKTTATQDLTDLATTYTNLVNSEKTARTNTIASTDLIKQAANSSKNDTVQAAITAYDNVVSASQNGKATTQNIVDAANAITTTLGDAQKVSNQATAALKQSAGVVRNEQGVQDAFAALQAAVSAQPNITADLIKTTAAYNTAIDTANDLRQQAVLAGKTAMATQDAQDFAQNASVKSAIGALLTTEVHAATANATTQDITVATHAVTAAVAAAKAATGRGNTLIKTADKAVANESNVLATTTTLTNLLADSTSATNAITDAITAFNQAQNDAENARTAAINAGNAIVTNLDSSIANDATVSDLVTAYDNLKAAANLGAEDATTAALNDASAAITAAAGPAVAARQARDTAYANGAGNAGIVTNEPTVQAAFAALVDPAQSWTTDAMQIATNTYVQAISDAKTIRTNTISVNKKIVDALVSPIVWNTTVAQAKQIYELTQDLASRGERTTADVMDAFTTLRAAYDLAAATTSASKIMLNDYPAAPVDNEQPVINAKQALTAGLAKASTPTAQLKLLSDAYQSAVDSAKKSRQDAIDGGTSVVTGVDATTALNATVAAAMAAYTATVNGSNNIRPTTLAITQASGAITTAVNQATTAKATANTAVSEAGNQDNISVQNEPAVVAALANLTTANQDATTATQTLLDDAGAYRSAVTAALADRQTATAAGNAVVKNSQPTANSDGQTAIAAYNDAVSDAGTGKGSTQLINQAIANLKDVIGKASAAKSVASTTVVPSYVSKELNVQDAAKALTTAVNTQLTSTSELTRLTTAYTAAVGSAEAARNAAITAGHTIVSGVTATESQNPEVKAAVAAYTSMAQDALATGTQVTTSGLKAASGAITAALGNLDTVNHAVAAAKGGTLNLETGVANALKTLRSLTDNSSTADKTVAVATYTQAMATAQTIRDGATATGTKAVNAAKASPVAGKHDVAAALTRYAALLANATSAERVQAAQAIDSAVAAAQQAHDDVNQAITTVVTAVADEPTVIQALQQLQNAQADSNLTTSDLKQQLTDYQAMVATAQGDRQKAIAAGNIIRDASTTQPYAQFKDVATALSTYATALADSDSSQTKTAVITADADAIKTAASHMRTAVYAASKAQLSVGPYSEETDVQVAEMGLANVLSDPSTASAAAITAATGALNTAIGAAKTARQQVIDGAAASVALANSPKYKNRSDIALAYQNYLDAVAQAGNSEIDTAGLQTAATALATSISNLDDAISAAKTGNLGNVASEPVVAALNRLLTYLEKDGNAADAQAINDVAQGLGAAVVDATAKRKTVTDDASDAVTAATTADDLKEDPTIKIALQRFQAATTTAAMSTTADALKQAITVKRANDALTASIARANAALASSQDVANELDAGLARQAVDDAISAPGASAATVDAAVATLNAAADSAMNARNQAMVAALASVANAEEARPTLNPVWQRRVQNAVDALNHTAKDSVAAKATTAQILADSQTVNAILATATHIKTSVANALEATDFNPVGNEIALTAAQWLLQAQAILSDGDQPKLDAAVANYKAAVQKMKDYRQAAIDAGNAAKQKAQQTLHQPLPNTKTATALQAAIDNFDAVSARAIMQHATTVEVNVAAAALDKAIADEKQAEDAQAKADAVARAAAAAAQAQSDADAQSRNNAQSQNVKDTTKQQGDRLVKQATDDHLADVPDVAQAIQQYADALTRAQKHQASDADVQTAIQNLANAIKSAQATQSATGVSQPQTGMQTATDGVSETATAEGESQTTTTDDMAASANDTVVRHTLANTGKNLNTGKALNAGVKTSKNDLPQTGDSNNGAATGSGVFGLALTTLFGLFGLAKKRED
ncbi:KxYKxGKxW signal peptide domain-containing protein [Lacticaseibacillus pabuli]|uniref:KxYKxGKxW signal peptide domain-containing protein n=1 Tax=Lacticaseibacillus pabuli TaxID=3025672 RepID=A0ABY7WRV5_9LACO|nr:KxYKxGKxW signal peptide domain-containing protein [Lacticaseibacillus sp. KACC 23028]WDF82920.1 KxYKxGKxW signal peptide domain-containing protein [Lacticaseibacillus sp. KACC 23028]